MMLAPALLALLAVADPRPPIVELVLAGEAGRALEASERTLAAEPQRARELGLDYLRADLLERGGRTLEAAAGFARAMAAPPALLPWARYRAAQAHRALGQPEVAAGLAATLLSAEPPAALVRPGLELLRRALAEGGDCRRLDGLERDRFPAGERRRLDLTRAECLRREGRAEEARELALRLLAQQTGDALARDAAELVATLPGEPRDARSAELLGLAAHDHREFELATLWLERALAARPTAGARAWPLGYALARSEFWLGRYGAAAARFRGLAAATGVAERRSSALHQAGRALELAGDEAGATRAFAAAAAVEPPGEWTAAAQLSSLRLAALRGDEAGARALLARLAERRAGRSAAARGALFLAAGDLVRGRTAHAGEYLAAAARSHQASGAEIAYWRGRLAELSAAPEEAVARYLEALESDPFHPFANGARTRLARGELAAALRSRAGRESGSADPAALRRAELLLAAAGEDSALPGQRGRAALARQEASRVWLTWERVAVAAWPLWAAPKARPEDLLVGLGRFAEAPDAVARHFPAAQLALGFTGAALLAADGSSSRALAIAEGLFTRRPGAVPIEWVEPELRRLVYPFPWRAQLEAQAAARGVDPNWLVALAREESRFDPRALSPAAARGLTQFVMPTARQVAARAGLPEPRPEDLERPATALALGAAHLGELAERFGGRVEVATAAYNAGEDQAALWQRYCFSQEAEEYLSKIGFRETRAYVQKVLEARANYAALYPPDPVP